MATRMKYLLAGAAGFATALLLMAAANVPFALGPRESVAAASSLPVAAAPASALDQTMQPDAMRMAQVGQVIGAIAMLDSQGFHGMDEGINNGAIPAGSLGRARRSRLVTAAVTWPAPLQDTALRLQNNLGDLVVALQAEDIQAAKGPAHEVHEIEHALSEAAYTWLAEQSGLAGTPSSAPASGH